MNPQFEELAREIADAVTKGIEPRFEGLEKGFKGLEERIDGLEVRLTAHVDKQLASAVTELKRQAQIHKEELKRQAQIHNEELKDDVKRAAEGYDATLRKIDRELAALNEKVDNGFRDHALAIKNHSKQIAELQKRR